MQRYRVNFPLLIGLVVGSAVLLGGGYGLWRFQLERNADRLVERANVAHAEGDLVKASNLLGSYLRLRPDDKQVMVQLGETMAEIAESRDVEPQRVGQAIGFLEGVVREQPENTELRRRLVDLLMSPRIRMYQPSLDHISQLLNKSPGDPELEVMRATCLFGTASPDAINHAYRLIGYDQNEDTFDATQAVAPSDLLVYRRLATALRSDKNDVDLADRVVDQMVGANPQDGMAHLYRALYLEQNDRDDEAKEEIARALELGPKEVSIVVANARMLSRDGDQEGARGLLRGLVEEQPEEASLYQTLAEIDAREGEYDSARKWFEQGIAAVAPENAQTLLFSQARLQIEQDDNEGARQTIATMRESEQTVGAFVDYLDARLAMSESRWFDAVKQFEELEDFMANVPGIGLELQLMRGFCYEKLGQYEQAQEAYDTALQIDPENTVADFGRTRMRSRRGQRDTDTESTNIYALMSAELAKPESEQDWDSFDRKADEYIKRLELGDAMRAVLQGEVLMRRGLYDEARAKLVESYRLDPDNLGVRRAAVKLFAADPDQGPVKALRLLDQVVNDFGDLPILRLERADLLIAINDEDLKEQLFALADGTEDWPADQQVQLWSGLSAKFERLRDADSRRICLTRVAELSPSDLPALLRLFMMARESDDLAGMTDAQAKILDVVGGEGDPTWLYTEAHRLVAQYRSNGLQGDGLQEASELVERALAERGEWHQLHQLKAEINLLSGDEQAALASFDRAAQYGRPTALSLYQHVQLLMRRGRFADALVEMERVSAEVRQRLLGRDYASCLLRVGQVNEAIVAADQLAELAPNNGQVQLWMGQFFAQAAGVAGQSESQRDNLNRRAEAALRKAVELTPSSADAWLALTGHLVATGQGVEAEDTVRRAQLALVEDETLLLFARCHELVGRSIDAEALYKQAVEEAAPSAVARASRLLAQFYLGPIYRYDDKVQKATPLINTVLREAAEGRADPNDPNVRWARTTAARLLASGGQYQQLRDAERLLSSNVVGGVLPAEDRLLMADILASRPEPVSRLKAARLLEGLKKNGSLTLKSELDLGRLYFALGEWEKCREQMIETIARHADEPRVRIEFLNMLIQHGTPADIDDATQQLRRLVQMAPRAPATRELVAKVAHRRGKLREASAALANMLPRNLDQVTAEQLPIVKRVAMQLEGFEDYPTAGRYYQLAAKLGGEAERLDFAAFIGKRIDAEKGFAALEQLSDSAGTPTVVQRGLEILRSQESAGEALNAEHLEKVEGWVTSGLRLDPENTSLLLQQADIYDLRQQYDKAADQYRTLLAGGELRGVGRAVVLNNLAYLLALSPTDASSIDEAVRYVGEAVDLLGPQTDILDTRAVTSIAAQRYDDAIADLELSLIDRPTASKYFHKAVAHTLNGQPEKALEAWEQAVELGLTRDSISNLEREQYDRIKARLEGAGLLSAGV